MRGAQIARERWGDRWLPTAVECATAIQPTIAGLTAWESGEAMPYSMAAACVAGPGIRARVSRTSVSSLIGGVVNAVLSPTSCATDCSGEVGGSRVRDNCGQCDSIRSNDCSMDCASVWGGSAVVDICGICGGNSTICLDCNGSFFGVGVVDRCGNCSAHSGSRCVADCLGVWGGNATVDACGVCAGNGSSCAGPRIPLRCP
jgi:hypothetical protein